jgi:cytoskeletal protein CcmA (bactofilin family)
MYRTPLIISILVLLPWYAGAENASFTSGSGNIYSAGTAVTITGSPRHDVIVAGAQIVISGNVGEDLMAAGGTILLSGTTGGDARLAGGTVTIGNIIGGEAVLAGGSIRIQPRAVIVHDCMAAAREVAIEGTLEGPASIIAETVTINGTISRDIDIRAGQLMIGKNAVIKGELRYTGPEEARVDKGAVITGGSRYTKSEFEHPRETGMRFFQVFWLAKLMAVITAALALYLLFPQKTTDLTSAALNHFGRALLHGFILVVTVPVLILILFLTVAGSLLGMFGIFFFTAFLLLSTVLGALIFTRLISGYIFKKEPSLTWPIVLLGVLIYQILGLAPFLGWVLKLVFFLSAAGALLDLFRRSTATTPAPFNPD